MHRALWALSNRSDAQRSGWNGADIRVTRNVDLHSAPRIAGCILAGDDGEMKILGIRRRTRYGVGDRTKDVAAACADQR